MKGEIEKLSANSANVSSVLSYKSSLKLVITRLYIYICIYVCIYVVYMYVCVCIYIVCLSVCMCVYVCYRPFLTLVDILQMKKLEFKTISLLHERETNKKLPTFYSHWTQMVE